MRKTLIAVTRYLGEKRHDHKFHFKGVYQGNQVRLLLVDKSSAGESFKTGEDYLLHLYFEAFNEKGELRTRLIKYKELEDTYWD